MAINAYDISDTAWTAISSAGQSGTFWIKNRPAQGRVVIFHSDSGTGTIDIENGYYVPNTKDHMVTLVADNPEDIFYARCSDPDDTAKVIADMF